MGEGALVMKQRQMTACLMASLLVPAVARANPEPTAYDARSIAMGLTGTTYMDRASALVLNPANLDGIGKLGFQFHFTGLFTNQRAPVQGPNSQVDSGLGFGPIPSAFIAGRIAPRVVFAGGLYIETGYGSSFDDVTCLDGAPDPDNPDSQFPDSNPETCLNKDPQNLDVRFFVGEFSTGFSIRAHEKLQFGLAVRLPFAKQNASLYQNIGAAAEFLPNPFYARVDNNIGGVGFPSLRAGFTIKPHRKVRLSAMFRMYSRIKLTGSTETVLAPGADPQRLDAQANWNIPNALQFGVSYQANSHLLLAFEARRQWHASSKTGNENQTVIASDPSGVLPTTELVVPFGWENVWSMKVGFEYRFVKDILALRLGANFANAATSPQWAQYFTPPPAPFNASTVMAGLGFYWDDRNDPSIKDKYQLDLGGLFAWSGQTIGSEYIGDTQLIPGTDPSDPNNYQEICSGDQVVRTGCPGKYRVLTYWASLSFTLQY
jgi:long-subunit fatty acid transport protein